MDSTTLLEQIETSQASKEVTANNLFDAASPATSYGRHAETSDGLNFGYYGTRYGGTLIANGSNLCDASTTVYMVMDLGTGAVTFDTDDTDWNDATNFGRCYLITAGTATITGYEDHRFGPSGIFGGGGSIAAALGTAASLDFDTDPTFAANSDTRLPTQKAVNTAIAGQINGIANKTPVKAATTGALPANTYANGTLGVGATLTGNSNGALAAQDGITLGTNDRLWVKNETAAANNGIYALTQVGDGSHPYILTRATDTDTSAEMAKASALVQSGTTQAKQVWTVNNSGAITVGTTAVSVVQTNTSAGDASTNTNVSVIDELALFADALGKTFKRATQSGFALLTAGVLSVRTLAQLLGDLQGDGLTSKQAGFRNIPQNSQSADYTTVAADSGAHVFHPAADTTARTWTIDSNAHVAAPIGTAITFINQRGAGNVTIAISTDTMDFAGTPAGTGSRILAPNGWATALKITATNWIITGIGLI